MNASKPHRILVVEDEYFLADDLRRMLDREGAELVGPVATEAAALALLDRPVDCAVLDINLRGRMVYPLARLLKERGVPFLFVSGYEDAGPDQEFADVALIQKPFAPDAVLSEVDRLLSARPVQN